MVKKVTIEDLAVMVKRGFDGTDKQIKEMRGEMNERFDKVERLILADHKRRIERLEEQMKDLRDLLAVK